MAKTTIVTLDLKFRNRGQTIACYLIHHPQGALLVECGPGSTVGNLKEELAREGLRPSDVTHVLLTHIHLDHGGAAGWWSRQGAEIHVHPNGAPHLLDPAKLLASAARIYGDQMHSLWGDFLPVEERQLRVAQDGQPIKVGIHEFIPINTPGHAEHHFAYLFENVCFSGDIGGVRIPGHAYMRAPMPPPELHFGRWHESLARLRGLKFGRMAPTHFGIYDDPAWQLDELEKHLHAAQAWLKAEMVSDPALELLREHFTAWMNEQARKQGLTEEEILSYNLANPLGMSADGMMRYWRKVALGSNNSTNVTLKA
jgi:glyoxylase-like metal-dependent hydrolase (beta-lactamase superfamily II)